jgi:hypothetical protein
MHNGEILLLLTKKRFVSEEIRLHLLLVHIYTNEVSLKLTSVSRTLLEEIIVAQLLQKSPLFFFIETKGTLPYS